MRKAISKLAGPKKLVRRVLSKSSNTSQTSNESRFEQNSKVTMSQSKDASENTQITQEIETLKDQINNLKAAVNVLQTDLDSKDIFIAKLVREKEKISTDLLKQKRSNTSLFQQLEDERDFYYKEKELYCQEMNEYKKLKRNISLSSIGGEKSVLEYKEEIAKLKKQLSDTFEANYNLSIKFLRMKNTKTCIKTELKKAQLDHNKIVANLKTKIENLSTEINDLVREKLSTPITPSNKKYLQLVKQNSCLVYENLCLQLETDKLNSKFDKLKLSQVKNDTNSRLKYINHNSEQYESTAEHKKQQKARKRYPKDQKHVRIQHEKPEKLEKTCKSTCEKKQSDEVIKLFERKNSCDSPQIEMLNDAEIRTVPESSIISSRRESNICKLAKVMEGISSQDDEKLNLCQMSDVISSDLTDCNSQENVKSSAYLTE